MPSWKRKIYGQPFMRFYRDWRSRQIAAEERVANDGFKFAGYEVFLRENWEVTERSLVKALLPQVQVFLDIGASHGFYSCLAAKEGLAVAAVEAERNSQSVLAANIKRNAFENVEIFQVALSFKVGIADFFGDGDCASLDRSWTGVAQNFSQLVPTNTLDNLFSDRWRDEGILIKIDVEGVEADVLKGGGRMIGRSPKPIWLIETFPRQGVTSAFRTIFEIMFRAGYSAIVANEVQTLVTMDMVEQWANDPTLPGRGLSNFLFFDADAGIRFQ